MIIPDFVWGLASSGVTLVSMLPYIYRTFKGVTRPHIFSWIIWTALTAIIFAVQYSSGAGAGAWATLVTCLCCLMIVIVAAKHGDKYITRMDWIMFIASLAAIPIWFFTDNPALAAVWAIFIDGMAYGPTMRKCWNRPHEEYVFTHLSANLKHVFSLLGMKTVSVATTLYPAALLFFNGALVAIILWRRHVLKKATS
jgi:hypothetical protein